MDYGFAFLSATNIHKDVALALDLAHRAGVAIPTGALTSQLLADAYLAAQADAQAARAAAATDHDDQRSNEE